MYEISFYELPNGKSPFKKWLLELDITARQKININLSRLKLGNFGNCESVGGNVIELKINFGPGFRIYFALLNNEIFILLAGSKKRQQTDIDKAKVYLEDYRIESKKNAKKKL
ncbi:hypothetical protein A3F66_02615 [candidate division TM6 bacterium RIFCSPHIGHO2_12_FULL_32_22]|nr:MAG: hypothetical protein A3F66_02615 [candidate division TM6 bacterium RIFCSPHIGHO2_12_FULL_32_22]